MIGEFQNAEKIYIACGYTDMRKSIDGLAQLVQQNFKLDPFDHALFLFCGRRKNLIKALYWEGNRFVLLYKRLEVSPMQFVNLFCALLLLIDTVNTSYY